MGVAPGLVRLALRDRNEGAGRQREHSIESRRDRDVSSNHRRTAAASAARAA
jgi:hypothetical protein